ncbi:hypothetical protein LJB97_03455 [Parabacteroides sp. OttesenSCG-928-O15]|nr:hypothetical protein [Parabacteroides sp. OttesenSCG-928-O15]
MNDPCWVYIIRDPKAENRLQAALAANLPQLLRDSADREIIYYRQFVTTLDAVAHKLLLSTVETDTLYDIIRNMNPTIYNLRKDFEIHEDVNEEKER